MVTAKKPWPVSQRSSIHPLRNPKVISLIQVNKFGNTHYEVDGMVFVIDFIVNIVLIIYKRINIKTKIVFQELLKLFMWGVTKYKYPYYNQFTLLSLFSDWTCSLIEHKWNILYGFFSQKVCLVLYITFIIVIINPLKVISLECSFCIMFCLICGLLFM